jgi:hypothetical protein
MDFTKVVRDCDVVFDTVWGDVAQRSFTVLKTLREAAHRFAEDLAPIIETIRAEGAITLRSMASS